MNSVLTVTKTLDGTKNAGVQICGQGLSDSGEWEVVAEARALRTREIRVDAVYYAICDGVEVQFRWGHKADQHPMMALAGRGRIDFSEVAGVVNTGGEGRTGDIEMRVLGTTQESMWMVLLDLSKHQGRE